MTFHTEEILAEYQEQVTMENDGLAGIGGTDAEDSPTGQEFVPDHFQIRKRRQKVKRRAGTPDWVYGNDFARRVLGDDAINRLNIAYRYWRCGDSSADIAADLGLNVNYVKKVVHRLRTKMSP